MLGKRNHSKRRDNRTCRKRTNPHFLLATKLAKEVTYLLAGIKALADDARYIVRKRTWFIIVRWIMMLMKALAKTRKSSSSVSYFSFCVTFLKWFWRPFPKFAFSCHDVSKIGARWTLCFWNKKFSFRQKACMRGWHLIESLLFDTPMYVLYYSFKIRTVAAAMYLPTYLQYPLAYHTRTTCTVCMWVRTLHRSTYLLTTYSLTYSYSYRQLQTVRTYRQSSQ